MSYKDLFVDQACDFSVTLNLTNPDGTFLNVAGYSFTSNIKASYYSNTVVDSMVITAVDEPNGNISVSWAAANSANVDASVVYVYDVIGKSSSNVTSKILNGLLRLNPTVTGVSPPAVIGG